jgi:uncharacterized membrane protein
MSLTLSKSRIEALSDGIFAIAMTLLVLKLEVPEVMHHESNETMLQELLSLKFEFFTYVVTFLIAGRFWYLHHLTFHFIRNVDGFLLAVNLLFLMFISLLPFSAGLMSHLFIHPISLLFYFGNQLAIGLLLNLHWHYARRRNLIADTEPREAARLGFRVGMIAAIFAACFVTAIFFPDGFPIFLAAGLTRAGGAIIERTRRRKGR